MAVFMGQNHDETAALVPSLREIMLQQYGSFSPFISLCYSPIKVS